VASEVAKLGLADRYEDLAHRCINGVTPRKIQDADLRSLVWSSAVSVDKMRLLREQPPPVSEAQLNTAEALKRC